MAKKTIKKVTKKKKAEKSAGEQLLKPTPQQKEMQEKLCREKQEESMLSTGVDLGGVFKGIGNFLTTVTEMAEQGEQIREIKDIGGIKGKRAIIGYNVRTIKGGKPSVSTFGNVRKTKLGSVVDEKRKPLVDVFDQGNELKIVAELPGVEEKDIRLSFDNNKLAISVNTQDRKYYKEVGLPSAVKEKISKTYRNGVLEIKLTKAKK